MAYEVKFSKKAVKAYKKLPVNIRLRIDKKIEYLRLTPRGSDTKNLLVRLIRIEQGLVAIELYMKLKITSF